MIIKNLLLFTLVLLAQQQLNGQFYSSASASTGVDIIEPVGAGKSGELITGSFYSGKEKSTVVLNRYGIQVNGKNNATDPGSFQFPTLQVFSSQQAYSITFSFDTLINNRSNVKETIRIESINIFPVNELMGGLLMTDKFSIGTTLQLAPNQAPGQYTSGNPYKVTINFN